jgi:transcriptional regulator with XRE-family HTH domain
MANSSGEYIKNKRDLKNLTQEAFAFQVGVSTRTISKWENGSNIAPKYYERIAAVLGVTAVEIMAGKDLDALDKSTKERLDRELQALIDVTDNVEDRGILALDMAAKAFGVAVIAFAVALLGLVRSSAVSVVLCVALVFFGIWFMFKGNKIVKALERKKQERRESRES